MLCLVAILYIFSVLTQCTPKGPNTQRAGPTQLLPGLAGADLIFQWIGLIKYYVHSLLLCTSSAGFFYPQSNQSAGPVRFLIFCSTSISLLANLVAGRRHQWTAGADQQGMYSTIPIHWNIKSAPASPGRSRVGPAFYVFSFLASTCHQASQQENTYRAKNKKKGTGPALCVLCGVHYTYSMYVQFNNL